jgi:hypothetical protein
MSRSAWIAAAAITIGFVVAEYAAGRFASLYVDYLGPLAASCWLGFALNASGRARGPR